MDRSPSCGAQTERKAIAQNSTARVLLGSMPPSSRSILAGNQSCSRALQVVPGLLSGFGDQPGWWSCSETRRWALAPPARRRQSGCKDHRCRARDMQHTRADSQRGHDGENTSSKLQLSSREGEPPPCRARTACTPLELFRNSWPPSLSARAERCRWARRRPRQQQEGLKSDRLQPRSRLFKLGIWAPMQGFPREGRA